MKIRVRKDWSNGDQPRYRYYGRHGYFTEDELKTVKSKEFIFTKSMEKEDIERINKKWQIKDER